MKQRKSLVVSLVATLALSTAAGVPAPKASAELQKTIPTLIQQKPAQISPLQLEVPKNQNEVIRVIVELDDAPAIEEATKKGKRYKDLSDTEKETIEAKLKGKQKNVKDKAKGKAKSVKFKEEFTTVFNGFSAEVEAKDLEALASTEGVKRVYESLEYSRPVEQPNMVTSKELVQAQLAWDKYQFKGEGMVIGVIDSGIDPSHRDFVLSPETDEELTKKEIDKLVKKGSIDAGKYFSEKVPFGYNYMDDNQEVRDLGPDASMHGQHVSGTVGANGDESNGGIKGVAPEAQILALKVFGNDPLFPSTYGDIYVKAIDDAIKLGADVINMSLGSTAGYQDENSPEQKAVSRAQKNGLIVSISAGNSDMFGSGTWYPSTTNQDYGLTGSPSVSKDSFGVASFENTSIAASGFKYLVNGVEAGEGLFLLANGVDPEANTNIEILDAGLGKPEDFAGKDFSGKYALVARGEINFTAKGLNAQSAGAAGVIVYNNAAGTINMASDPRITIPYMSALQVDGLAMKKQLDDGNSVAVNFDGRIVNTPNPQAGKMSSFTSWGPTPNLDFKPEITAPGGNIFSTLNSDQYGLMSGTSMAAPHVAGGSALVLERVDNEFKLKGAKRSLHAKNLLMNTAKPVELNPGEYVSPRRQGAGIMQLANALETDVMVTNKATGEAKVALKEIKDGTFTFTLKVENFGDSKKTYNVGLQLQTDAPVNAGANGFITLPNNAAYGSIVLENGSDYESLFNETITLGKKETKELTFEVDASTSGWLKDYFTNGYFIDGFVTLEDATPGEEDEVLPSLVVPFFGFNGSWDDASIFDENYWEGPTSFWGIQGLYTAEGKGIPGKALENGSVDPSTFAFSPNGDGTLDTALPIFSLMRNAKEFQVNVLDSTGKVVRTIRNEFELRKNYISTNPYTFNPVYAWDGKINGQFAPDGDYTIQLKAKIDFEGAVWQTENYALKLDTKAPETEFVFNEETKILEASTVEVGSGIDRVEIYHDGEIVDMHFTETTAIDLSSYEVGQVDVVVWDVAGNYDAWTNNFGSTTPEEDTPPTGAEETPGSDNKGDSKWESGYDAPVIYIDEPGFFSVHKTSNVLVAGEVKDNTKVTNVKINGVNANFDGTNFSSTLEFKDGVHIVRVEASDDEGNTTSIQRRIFVDTQAARITTKVKNFSASKDAKSFELPITLTDNFDEVRLYVNDSEIFYNSLSEPYEMNGYRYDTTVTIPLNGSITTAVIKVTDLAGNETNFEVTIDQTNLDKPGKGKGKGKGNK
ncbi:S8 family serine peptidase [Chryseomicrobium palamuruense]|uniref:S8 family serine peptidase n=1 Tax=Chryseomicrobium palamuruense TaxID=682973 RepID=A0ABV8UXQ8_9BACL